MDIQLKLGASVSTRAHVLSGSDAMRINGFNDPD
jgi:hypothetical protein